MSNLVISPLLAENIDSLIKKGFYYRSDGMMKTFQAHRHTRNFKIGCLLHDYKHFFQDHEAMFEHVKNKFAEHDLEKILLGETK